MTLTCPYCQRPLSLPPGAAPGYQILCPSCSGPLVVPGGAQAPYPQQQQAPYPQQQQAPYSPQQMAPYPPQQMAPYPPQQMAPYPPQQMAPYPPQQMAPYPYPPQPTVPRRSRTGLILVPVLLVLAAGVGVGAYLWLGRSDSSDGSAGTATAGSGTDKAPPKPTQQIWFDAQRFREAAALDLTGALERYHSAKAFGALLSRPRAQGEPALWPLFFAGALTLVGHAPSPHPVVAYYNPLLDAMLLTSWEVTDQGPRIREIAVRAGSDLGDTEGPPDPLARWLVSRASATEALASQTEQSVAAFEKAFPDSAGEVAALPQPALPDAVLEAVEGHLVVTLAQLEAIHDRGISHIGDLLWALRKRLASDDAAALAEVLPADNVVSAAELLELPAELRTAMRPIYTVVAPDKILVFLAPAAAPRILGVYEFLISASVAEARSFVLFDVAPTRG